MTLEILNLAAEVTNTNQYSGRFVAWMISPLLQLISAGATYYDASDSNKWMYVFWWDLAIAFFTLTWFH